VVTDVIALVPRSNRWMWYDPSRSELKSRASPSGVQTAAPIRGGVVRQLLDPAAVRGHDEQVILALDVLGEREALAVR
jgi:hypothetical protein